MHYERQQSNRCPGGDESDIPGEPGSFTIDIDMMDLPLKDLVVLEFSQYLSGPSAGLRLADLGARVIKIERPVTGDAGRKLAIKNLWVNDSSLLFHTINRNKESITANNASDLPGRVRSALDAVVKVTRPGAVAVPVGGVKTVWAKVIVTKPCGLAAVGAGDDAGIARALRAHRTPW